jgi:hypothetical protein
MGFCFLGAKRFAKNKNFTYNKGNLKPKLKTEKKTNDNFFYIFSFFVDSCFDSNQAG